jgi:hypothetical protein
MKQKLLCVISFMVFSLVAQGIQEPVPVDQKKLNENGTLGQMHEQLADFLQTTSIESIDTEAPQVAQEKSSLANQIKHLALRAMVASAVTYYRCKSWLLGLCEHVKYYFR